MYGDDVTNRKSVNFSEANYVNGKPLFDKIGLVRFKNIGFIIRRTSLLIWIVGGFYVGVVFIVMKLAPLTPSRIRIWT